MIKRNYATGEKLDVAGLNQINVLLDRSESEYMEIGYNEWPVALSGPPHRHEDKDQIFCFLHGAGEIAVGDKTYPAQPGRLLHIPAYTLHQTINPVDEPLGYLLLNIFNSESKEGHGSFKEHIEEVKAIRKKQAETQDGGYTPDDASAPQRPVRYVENMDFAHVSNETLLPREATDRFNLSTLTLAPDTEETVAALPDYERAVFVLSGSGKAALHGESAEPIQFGDLIYIPGQKGHQFRSGTEQLNLLCLDTSVK